MGDERYPSSNGPQRDYYGRDGRPDYAQDYGSGRQYTASSAREYEAAGELGGDRQADRQRGGQPYGQRDYGYGRYGQREAMNRGRNDDARRYGQGENRGYREPDRSQLGGRDQGAGYGAGQGRSDYHGSYASDGRRFEDVGRYAHADDDDYRGGQGRDRGYDPRSQDQRQGRGGEDRGFFARAGDEVRSWFGDEEAERRRERDAREHEQMASHHRDADYHSWRSDQIAAFDRDYQEYREENRSKFHNEFSTWRTQRQGQRDALNQVEEHMEVVGLDGQHVGTVDKVRGDRILLTKNDADAGGRHHSIPSRWIQSVEGKVTLSKTADEAKAHWRDEERSQAMFGDETHGDGRTGNADGSSTGMLDRSFSGTR